MKRIALILSIVGSILTFVGAIYVMYNHGNANAGYACIPMLFTLVCLSLYRQQKHSSEK